MSKTLFQLLTIQQLICLLLCNFSYIFYSHIAAKTVRAALKAEFKVEAKKREKSLVQIYKFVDGKKGGLIQTLVIGEQKDDKDNEENMLKREVKN